ncbi:MAG: Smr/MutS family protein [Acidobacteriota bacterium]
MGRSKTSKTSKKATSPTAAERASADAIADAPADDAVLFDQAMAEVAPLPAGPGDAVPFAPRPRPLKIDPALLPVTQAVTFVDLEHGRGAAHAGRLAGRAADAPPALVAQLRRGEMTPDVVVDLHGLRAETARYTLHRAIDDAWRERLQVLLVIHGRGRRSPDGPVLKAALPDWLAEPPRGPRVWAFAGRDPGATFVLLRPRRRKKS